MIHQNRLSVRAPYSRKMSEEIVKLGGNVRNKGWCCIYSCASCYQEDIDNLLEAIFSIKPQSSKCVKIKLYRGEAKISLRNFTIQHLFTLNQLGNEEFLHNIYTTRVISKQYARSSTKIKMCYLEEEYVVPVGTIIKTVIMDTYVGKRHKTITTYHHLLESGELVLVGSYYDGDL